MPACSLAPCLLKKVILVLFAYEGQAFSKTFLRATMMLFMAPIQFASASSSGAQNRYGRSSVMS